MTKPKVKLFAIAKDEAAYIPQWVYHHLYFGCDEIEIWLNGITDNSLEVCDALSEVEKQFKYKKADELLASCKKNNSNFQVLAYECAYRSAIADGFTHLFFLDLDEYFTPKNFRNTVKSLISSKPNVDAISLQWYFDKPRADRQAFSSIYNGQNLILQNDHVKTILKLTDNVKINMHNHLIENGVYVLYDGSKFEEADSLVQCNRAMVSQGYFDKNKGIVNDYFIYHYAYKSEIEYLASLSRGRSHVNDNRKLKVNRSGFIDEPRSHSPVVHSIDKNALDSYNKYLSSKLSQQLICSGMLMGQEYVIGRASKVLAMFDEEPYVILTHRSQFYGISNKKVVEFFDRKTLDFKFAIDKVAILNDAIQISGWCFAEDYSTDFDFKLEVNGSQRSYMYWKKNLRRDVLSHVDKLAPVDCGFELLFGLDDSEIDCLSIDLVVTQNSHLGAKIMLPDKLLTQAKEKALATFGYYKPWRIDNSGNRISKPVVTLPSDVAERVRNEYASAQVILEYGSGGSTIIASEYPEKNIFTVESDPFWALSLYYYFQANHPASFPFIYHANIGPTKEWGAPFNDHFVIKFPDYSRKIWSLSNFLNPDVVLIDGRFRVACFFAVMLYAKKKVKILFDDYIGRNYYAIVEKYVGPPIEVIDRMAIFEIAPGTLSELSLLEIGNYFFDPR